MELGIGGSHMYVAPSKSTSTSEFGLAPLSLGIGGFVSPDFAIMARLSGTSYFDNDRFGNTTQYTNGFYGVVGQYWLNDEFYVSAGPGLALFGPNPLFKQSYAERPVAGFGVSARAGYSFFTAKHHSVRLAIEATPAFYENAKVFGTALNLEWQYF